MKSIPRVQQPIQQSREGVALIVALIALILCTAISMSLVKTTLLRQQRIELRQNQLQAQLLADSALELTAERFLQGNLETIKNWEVELNGEPGQVEITATENSTGDTHLQVRAQYPLETFRRSQVSLESTLSRNHDSEHRSETQLDPQQ